MNEQCFYKVYKFSFAGKLRKSFNFYDSRSSIYFSKVKVECVEPNITEFTWETEEHLDQGPFFFTVKGTPQEANKRVELKESDLIGAKFLDIYVRYNFEPFGIHAFVRNLLLDYITDLARLTDGYIHSGYQQIVCFLLMNSDLKTVLKLRKFYYVCCEKFSNNSFWS